MKVDMPVSSETIFLKDYQVPNFQVLHTELSIELLAKSTLVTATLKLQRHPQAPVSAPLVLLGADLELLEVTWNGQALTADDWFWQGEQWHYPGVTDAGVLITKVRIYPDSNLALEGLYRSHGLYCTQCEAEGFRKITLYPDRPDVLAPFLTTLIADRGQCPVLLSNGNCIATGNFADGRHWATWEDPHPKPSYLFAMVAGQLACLEDHFTTRSGRKVTLQIFTAPEDQDKCRHAMSSLQAAMRWDEERYGCEYDLDIYMIVAVSHFNMGAMENKGLNVFNTSCVLAHPATTTDAGFQRVESVVAHEYFHNWSGNRVTCRDWFQLCLKEGFTVFRDQQFSADQLSASVQRLEDVAFLRTHQFAEDAGPLAHPVRPESFVEINNFYTLTVYEKGAEIARMLHTRFGEAGFRRGTDLYFAENDGRAATVEDFLSALGRANACDLATWVPQWLRWYSQPGTPTVVVTSTWDRVSNTLIVKAAQSQTALAGKPAPEPLPIPLKIGFIGEQGALKVSLLDSLHESLPPLSSDSRVQDEFLLLLETREQSWHFAHVMEAPVLSLFRDLSAPVRIDYACDDAALARLIRGDSNGFNRWAAAQELASREILVLAERYQRGDLRARLGTNGVLASALADIWPALAQSDPALAAKMLELPSLAYLAEQVSVYDPMALFTARESLLVSVLTPLTDSLRAILMRDVMLAPYTYSADALAGRHLARLALDGLARIDPTYASELAQRWFQAAPHMSAEQAALSVLVQHQLPAAEAALATFYNRWHAEALVLDQWFATQVCVPAISAVDRARALITHADYDRSVPNRVRSVCSQLASANPLAFHREDGAGYDLLAAEVLKIDAQNPQLASRMVSAFGIWQKLDERRQGLIRAVLDDLLAHVLSADTRETLQRLRGDT